MSAPSDDDRVVSLNEWLSGETVDPPADPPVVIPLEDWIEDAGLTPRSNLGNWLRGQPVNKGKPRQNISAQVDTDGADQQRVWDYIEGIAGRQAQLAQGSRNDDQNIGARKAFRLALGVGIPLDRVEDVIYRAQELNGQVSDDGERQVRATMASARASAERDGPEYLEPRAPRIPPAFTIDPNAAPAGQAGQAGETDQAEGPRIWNANDLRPSQQAQWLGKKWIPRSAISILIGDEGIGKSLWWVRVAAAVSTGRALPECGIPEREPGLVVVVVTEDDWSSVVRPRLEVAEANLDMIRVICTEDDGSGAPVFPRDLHLIANMTPAPILVVCDAWLDTVPGGFNVRDPHGARLALHPWKEVATATGAAMVLLTHTNRVQSGSARDRYGITIELRKKARMTIFAQRDEETNNLVIGPEKVNSTATAVAAMYAIKSTQYFAPTDDDDGTIGELSFIAESARTSQQHLSDAFEDAGEDRDELTACRDWLESYLDVEGPGADSAKLKHDGKVNGFTDRTIQRARAKLGVIYRRTGFGSDCRTVWSLPHQVSANNSDDSDTEGR